MKQLNCIIASKDRKALLFFIHIGKTWASQSLYILKISIQPLLLLKILFYFSHHSFHCNVLISMWCLYKQEFKVVTSTKFCKYNLWQTWQSWKKRCEKGNLGKIWCFHTDVDKEWSLLWCYVMSTREYEVLTHYCIQQSLKKCTHSSILLDPEDEDTVLHRNGGNYFQIDITQHTRKGDTSRNYAIRIITSTFLRGRYWWMVTNIFQSTLNILETVVMLLLWY